jgi:heme a synthase
MASQGLVGSVQYELALPADIVWVHVALATLTWITLLWAVAAAGRLARTEPGSPEPAEVAVEEPQLAGAGRP